MGVHLLNILIASLSKMQEAPVIDEDDKGTKTNVGGGKASSRGTPQGGVIMNH